MWAISGTALSRRDVCVVEAVRDESVVNDSAGRVSSAVASRRGRQLARRQARMKEPHTNLTNCLLQGVDSTTNTRGTP